MDSSDQKPAVRSKSTGAGQTGQAQKDPRNARLSNRVVALSHPLRAEILRKLVERGLASPKELARELDADLGNVAYHTQRLVKLKCAELVETRPARGALEHFYRATELHVIDEVEWSEIDPVVAEDILRGNVQAIMSDFVASKKAGIVGSDPNCHVTRTPMVLDAEGLREAMGHFEALRLEISEIQDRSAERVTEAKEVSTRVTAALFLFKMPRARLSP